MTRAWAVVGACFLVAVSSWGLGFYAHGIYLVELKRATGWSTGLISSVVTAHYLIGALCLPPATALLTRFGPLPVLLAGLVLTAIAAALLPHVTVPWQLVAVYGLLAVGWGGTSIAAIAGTIGQWFDRRRGLALSLALSGATIAGLVLAPLLLQAIALWGFAQGLATIAIAYNAGAALVVLAVVRRGPPHGPEHPDARAGAAAALTAPPTRLPPETWGAALRTAHFWSITGPFALCLTAQVGFLTHLVPMLAERFAVSAGGGEGLDPGRALAIAALGALVGRIAFGLVLDRVAPRAAAAVWFLNQVAAIAVLALVRDAQAIYMACALYGLSVGNNITIAPLIVQREYAGHEFPRLVALSTAVSQICYAFGPAALGLLRDLTGAYTAPLWLCAGALVLATAWVTGTPNDPPTASHNPR